MSLRKDEAHTMMQWEGKRAAVVGLGISNTALTRFLVRQGAHVVAYDQQSQQQLGETYNELARIGVEFHLGPHYLDYLHDVDTIFVTPGMRKDIPALQAARKRGIEISSEMQLFLALCKARVIAVTGASGKTTTTTLIGEIMTAAGHDVIIGGNIGTPLIEKVNTISEDQWVVLELSSFQLENLHASPEVALVTNITPNHLDMHGTMEAYVEAKKQIYRFQSDNDWLVLNDDDHWADEMDLEARGNVRRFSSKGSVKRGAYVDGERLVIARSGQERRTLEQVCLTSDIRLLGEHNIDNVLAAVTVADLCGVRLSTMRDVITSFTGVPHRLEFVREAGGVKYYNDSIATTPTRTAAGIRSFREPIVLIAGGYDKGIPFDELKEAMDERVKAVVTYGQASEKIVKTLRKDGDSVHRLTVYEADDFEQAVKKAHDLAEPGDVVLLSPGCASYGAFRNFEERGLCFQNLVHDLTEKAAQVEQNATEHGEFGR